MMAGDTNGAHHFYIHLTLDGGQNWQRIDFESDAPGPSHVDPFFFYGDLDLIVIGGNVEQTGNRYPALWADDPTNLTGAGGTVKRRWDYTADGCTKTPRMKGTIVGNKMVLHWQTSFYHSYYNFQQWYEVDLNTFGLIDRWTGTDRYGGVAGGDGIISGDQVFEQQDGVYYTAGITSGDNRSFYYSVRGGYNQGYGNNNGTSCCRLADGTVLVCRRNGFGHGGWGNSAYYYPGVLRGTVPAWTGNVPVPEEWGESDASYEGTTLGAISTDRQTQTVWAVQITGGPDKDKILMFNGAEQVVIDFPPGVTTEMVYPGLEVIKRG
jgi:hypothetical protein